MLFFYNSAGTLIKVVEDHVYQGSDGATTLYFIAPISTDAIINVAFELTNGERSAQHVLTLQGGEALNGIVDEDGNTYSVWTYDLDAYETAYAGDETAQFFISLNGVVRATQSATFTVEMGVAPITAPAQGSSYTQIINYIQQISQNKQDKLTTPQLNAVNSGIDSTKVAKIDTNETAITEINGKIPEDTNATDNKLVNNTEMLEYSLPVTTKYGASLTLVFNSSNGVLTAQLKDQDGNNLGQAQTVTIDLTSIETAINSILALIPAQASAENQLADKNFVNSSISTNTAHFIGTFNSLAELEAYSGTVTNNDYANVTRTVDGQTYYDRYTYNGSTSEWEFNFTINTTTFTAAQWAALNSGITAEKVAKIVTLDGNQTITGVKTFDGSDGARPIIIDDGNGTDTQQSAVGIIWRQLLTKKTSNFGAQSFAFYDFENNSAFDQNNHYKGVRIVKETTPAGEFDDSTDVLTLPQKTGTLATLDDIPGTGTGYVPTSRTIAGNALTGDISASTLLNSLFTVTAVTIDEE